VLPCYENFVLPFKSKASFVVMNNRQMKETISEVLHAIADSGVVTCGAPSYSIEI
jgi:hypothetical protein